MAKNVRKTDGGITPWGLLGRLVLFLLFVSFGLSIVMQQMRTQRIGREIKEVEDRIAQLRTGNMMLQAQVSDLKTPRSLIQKSAEWNLNLHPVADMQVVKCVEPSANSTLLYAQTMIAQGEGVSARRGARASPVLRR
ncbi:MAG: hypothetical protein JO317_01025 [Verrucomicrobiae bacterium]|nr:hypothetical protein [Verrucomicrobiae bacterium]